MPNNLVTFGFANVHYAMYKDGKDGELGTFEVPERLVGGVNFTPAPQGGTTSFHADNVPIFTITQDNGVEGDLEMSNYPDEFLVKILNWALDKKGGLIEIANVPQAPFALLFEVIGNVEPVRYTYFHCMGSKPSDNFQTAEDTPNISGKAMNLKATPLQFDGFAAAAMRWRPSQDKEVYDNWFKEVYIPELADLAEIPEA